ncbi:14932_t:CDS:2, partial [Cetraspora pellucida]
MNNCNKLYNKLSYDEVINSSDEDKNNEFSLEALDSLLKENSSDIRLRTSQGSSIHVSEFICETIGQLCLSQEEKEANDLLPDNECLPYTDACIIWTNEDGIKQVSERAISIFERTHPRKVALFMFDNSCNHNSFAEDALLVSQMNMKDGGKRPLLHNGRMCNSSIHIMTFVDQDNKVKPKGIKRVLQECGLWVSGLTRECDGCKAGASTNLQCCATNILKSQPDFVSQKNHLQEIIEAAGYLCLKKTVSHALESHDLFGKAAVFAIKKYRSHRRVPE